MTGTPPVALAKSPWAGGPSSNSVPSLSGGPEFRDSRGNCWVWVWGGGGGGRDLL